jgi:hypothetical protein
MSSKSVLKHETNTIPKAFRPYKVSNSRSVDFMAVPSSEEALEIIHSLTVDHRSTTRQFHCAVCLGWDVATNAPVEYLSSSPVTLDQDTELSVQNVISRNDKILVVTSLNVVYEVTNCVKSITLSSLKRKIEIAVAAGAASTEEAAFSLKNLLSSMKKEHFNSVIIPSRMRSIPFARKNYTQAAAHTIDDETSDDETSDDY